MELGNYSIKKIREKIYNAVTDISSNVFTSNRPSSIDPAMNDFIVITIGTNIYDRRSHGTARCTITLYARNNGVYENNTRLEEMQSALYAKLPIHDDDYLIYDPMTYEGGSDNNGFHRIHVNVRIFIKHT